MAGLYLPLREASSLQQHKVDMRHVSNLLLLTYLPAICLMKHFHYNYLPICPGVLIEVVESCGYRVCFAWGPESTIRIVVPVACKKAPGTWISVVVIGCAKKSTRETIKAISIFGDWSRLCLSLILVMLWRNHNETHLCQFPPSFVSRA